MENSCPYPYSLLVSVRSLRSLLNPHSLRRAPARIETDNEFFASPRPLREGPGVRAIFVVGFDKHFDKLSTTQPALLLRVESARIETDAISGFTKLCFVFPCLFFQFYPAFAQGNQGCLGATVDVQFAVDFTETIGNSVFGEVKPLGNGFIICPLSYKV